MEDTIAAISTVVGESALNVIKVSGNDSISIVNSIFKGKDLTKVESHTIHYGFIMDKDEKIDEVLVSIFKAPKTYTREDVVEINCHGGIAVTNKILELLLINGCRMAEPGEFIKRAYLNGRVNLVEAEAVSDLISAKTDIARKIGIKGLTGQSSKLIKDLREELLSLIANIEVNIDYPEYEDAVIVTKKLIKEKIENIIDRLKVIVSKSEDQLLIKNAIKISIVGKPNVGKSSILNKFLNEEKAIVTDIEGTTRDTVEGSITLNGVELNFIDTAGIRNTENIVEKIGVEKSLKAIEEADLVLFVLDGTRKVSKEDLEIFDKVKDKKVIIIVNKSDEDQIIDISKFNKYDIILASTKVDDGLDELKNKIIEMFNLGNLELNDYTYLSNSRQIAILKKCLSISKEILKKSDNEEVDLLEIDIKALWENLGEILGETYKDDLLDEIFSKFCLGK